MGKQFTSNLHPPPGLFHYGVGNVRSALTGQSGGTGPSVPENLRFGISSILWLLSGVWFFCI